MSVLAIKGGSKLRTRPFHRWPHWDGRERRALLGVLNDGSWGGYPAPNKQANAFARKFAKHCGARYGVCAANGSVTLEIALQAVGLNPGDEVIVPAYSFVATASSVVFSHGVPIFVDVDPDTYCIDPKRVEKSITRRTRAIIPVHLACNMADMDAIGRIARKHKLAVIEDCAHAHGARWRGKCAGAIGDAGSFSFQTSKLMTSGEGGILITSDKNLEMRMQSLANCGRKEPGYDRFDGRMLGKNYRISEWQAAVLSAQLDRLETQLDRREENAAHLERRLAGMPGIRFTRRDPRNTRRAIYQFIVKYDPAGFKGLHRDKLLEALRAEGIRCEGDFYEPIYKVDLFPMDRQTNPLATQDYARAYRRRAFECPVTERAAYREAIWLPHPLFLGARRDVDDVVRAVEKVLKHVDELL